MRRFGQPMVTLLLSPAEGWGGPLGSSGGLWPLVDYNIETSINYFFLYNHKNHHHTFNFDCNELFYA